MIRRRAIVTPTRAAVISVLAVALISLWAIAVQGQGEEPRAAENQGAASQDEEVRVAENGNVGQVAEDERERGRQVGAAFDSATDDVLAYVGSMAITAADYAAAKKLVTVNAEFTETMIAGNEHFAPLGQRLAIIEEAGVPNVALAGLIVQRALYKVAAQKGHSISDAEVEAEVATGRQLTESGEMPSLAGYVEAVGERYWTEIAPERIRMERVIEQLRADSLRGINDLQAAAAEWAAIEARAIPEANIDVLDSDAIAPATVSGALEYLGAYWTLIVEQRP